ncbi:hypothetical protein D5S17_35980 [Pseudonocardiaceae bacterium YIM PH 21723]|nr:hypothetical protein D5S17_35980 [Pseudonocardiaceae bacterium YIM PH 21723]
MDDTELPLPDPIAENLWANTIDLRVGGLLDELGAQYNGCTIELNGTRELSWLLPRRRGRRRRLELAFRALGGSLDWWEIVYREVDWTFREQQARYYASISERRELFEVESAVQRLTRTRLIRVRRPLTFGPPGWSDPLVAPLFTTTVLLAILLACSLCGIAHQVLLIAGGAMLLMHLLQFGVMATRRFYGPDLD